MFKVQLRDLRVKEFDTKEKAEKYAELTGGKVVDKAIIPMARRKLKQFWERS
jgi:hypothetical protein